MIKPPALTATQLQELKSILEQRRDLLQKQESLDFGGLVKTAQEGTDPESNDIAGKCMALSMPSLEFIKALTGYASTVSRPSISRAC
jgi:hypothetical protein